ncbi:MAG TPA: response regulator [Opitutaceae bacterium]|nr:response regulator [Opitutaceae bacterium]
MNKPIALSPHAGKRILIVDDVPDNLSVLFDFLRARGFKVLAAESGAVALAGLEAMNPDLILLDVMMPGVDGFETCRRIKARPKFEAVPVFFLTASTDVIDKVKGFDFGAVDYITKPLHPEEVLARVHAHLELRALQLALENRNEELDREIQQRIAAERTLQHARESAAVVVEPDGTMRLRTGPADLLLRRYCSLDGQKRLPDAVSRWLRDNRARANPLALSDASGGTLEIEQAPAPGEDRLLLLTLREKAAPPSPARLAPLGLTPRETEILFWVAQGKTSPEIALILDTAPETIKRHVKNFLPKLGVETRLAAALKAMELLDPA